MPAVQQALRLLMALVRKAPTRLKLTDLCRMVGIHRSKGYAILNTLSAFGFVQREPEGKRYGLGPGLIRLGRAALENLNFKELADPLLAGLASETGNPAFNDPTKINDPYYPEITDAGYDPRVFLTYDFSYETNSIGRLSQESNVIDLSTEHFNNIYYQYDKNGLLKKKRLDFV